MRTIYEVQTVNPETGEEGVVRVEASSPVAAREMVAEVGEVPGAVRLVEIAQDQETRVISPTIGRVPSGAVAEICPRCGAAEWGGGRGFILWCAVILTFPLGLLLLLMRPTWICKQCGLAYKSYAAPARIDSDRSQAQERAAGVILLLCVGLLVLGIIAISASGP